MIISSNLTAATTPYDLYTQRAARKKSHAAAGTNESAGDTAPLAAGDQAAVKSENVSAAITDTKSAMTLLEQVRKSMLANPATALAAQAGQLPSSAVRLLA
jgi:hypothetical protein